MKRLSTLCLVAALAAAGVACEETLEVCAPCGLPSEGNSAVSGDPRIDSALESAIRLEREGDRASAAFDEGLVRLADELGVELLQPSSPGLEDTQAVADALWTSLLGVEGVEVQVILDWPTCSVDSSLALRRHVQCETFADCFVTSSCESALRGSCTGRCVGMCRVRPEGQDTTWCQEGGCFQATDMAGDSCLEGCIGACVTEDGVACPGVCSGACDETCTSYTSTGDCAGFCPGTCRGICTSDEPMECSGDGVCDGLCRLPDAEDLSCPGLCLSTCPDGTCLDEGGEGTGTCIGHFRPEGCDLATRCSGVLECQEASRELAWAYIECGSTDAEVAVEFTPLFGGSRLPILSRAAALEEMLDGIMPHAKQISILVDGVDPSGGLVAADLEEEYDESLRPGPSGGLALEDLGEHPFIADRETLPLSGLKGRLGMLMQEATNGDYKIAAGPLPCVGPALEEAWWMVEGLIPMSCDDEDNDGVYEQCELDRTRGLYRVLDGMNLLVEAVTTTTVEE